MIPTTSSLTSSFIASTGQSPTEPNQPESISGDSVELKLSSDDDFYLLYSDKYQLMEKNKQFLAQLRTFLFDQNMSNDDKVMNLQMLFPPVDQSGDDVSFDQLRENMDLLFRNTFKQAQQRAMNYGLKP
ncbi:hypothetical protein [Endozoicomonas sp. GU-1]|uniref:hypothetical protein n=1 Tax=Endozoicomonas sp. GU-1 TaxID=3009078 RepID=UPI0022B4535E|nr:hypothetical protein [Endozoicomonas sp. GU-1]WBA83267.1 hypothetical protein O2T12_09175 [Endozoicomonas sp. GU-1]